MKKRVENVESMDAIIVCKNGAVKDSVEWKRDRLSLENFIKKLLSGDYDTSVIFQRDQVWTTLMKANLIRSIMVGSPIGDCLLCEKPYNVANANVIDFKNRSLAIQDFWLGEFAVAISLENEDGTFLIKYLTWPQIRDSNDFRLQNLKEQFINYDIHCIIYKGLSLVQQAKRYIIQNTQIPMQTEELLYGENFWLKGLFRIIHEYCLSSILKHTRGSQEKNNIHEKGTIFAQRVCYICYGAKFDDVWAIRDIGNSRPKGKKKSLKPMVRDARLLNEYLAEKLELEKTHNLDLDFVKNLSFWEKIEELKKVSNAIAEILWSENPIDKKFNKNDLLDFIIFIVNKISEKKLTLAMLKDDKKTFLRLLQNYQKNKGKDKTMTGQSVTTFKITERKNIFEECWENSEIDVGLKNKTPTKAEISEAYMTSGKNCPITGEALGNHNVRIEHVDCKSKNSETNYCLVSATGNAWKSNRTLEETKAILNYQENKL